MNRNGAPSPADPSSPSVDLSSLIARVEAATGPDRRLDLDICAALGTLEYGPTARGWTRHQHPELTASLDAALALVERVLPGWTVQLFERDPEDGGGWNARLKRRSPWELVALDEVAPLPRTAPLALLLALLRALQAQASAEGTHDGASPKTTSSHQARP